MFDLNLLPTNLVPDRKLLDQVHNLNVINIVASLILIIAVVLMLTLVMLNQSTLTNIENQKSELTGSIQSMEAIEQQYSLIKESASNINGILGNPDAEVSLKTFKEGYFDRGLTVPGKLIFSSIGTELDLTLPDLATLTQVINNINNNEVYKDFAIDGITYSTGKGYELIIKAK